MGRLRTKDLDLAPGWRRVNGKLYYQPTTLSGRLDWRRRHFSLPAGPLIYFIRAGGAVKVGYTSSKEQLATRISALQLASPKKLRFLGAVSGTRGDEKRAHAALRLWRRSGEWFGPSRAVTSYAREALRTGRIVEEQDVCEKTEQPPHVIKALEVCV